MEGKDGAVKTKPKFLSVGLEPDMYDRFFALAASQQRSGAGLLRSIVHWYVESHEEADEHANKTRKVGT